MLDLTFVCIKFLLVVNGGAFVCAFLLCLQEMEIRGCGFMIVVQGQFSLKR